MFTSKIQLINNFGVDEDIAAFFVDRKVPQENSYWEKRLLYVANGTGYLFIPLFFDIKLKMGVDKNTLLSEEYVQLSELILDSAARYEKNQYDFNTHIQRCKELVDSKTVQKKLFAELVHFFNQPTLLPYKYLGTTNRALNRGDSFLFLLCVLDVPETTLQEIIKGWYALTPSFLLMDDVMDLHEDKQRGEENSINEFGEGADAVKKAIEYLKNNFSTLKTFNQKLGDFFEQSLERKLRSAYLRDLLEQQ